MTYDKKCFNVYKTKCQDGYDEGKVNDLENNQILKPKYYYLYWHMSPGYRLSEAL